MGCLVEGLVGLVVGCDRFAAWLLVDWFVGWVVGSLVACLLVV